MSDPYRSEDQVTKLQDENEKLRQENDRLMWRFSSLRKWPAYLFFGLMVGVVAFSGFSIGASTVPQSAVNDTVSSFGFHRLDYQERVMIASEVIQRLTPALASHAHSTSSQHACPAPPVCASGADERILGMNKVVVGTIGGPQTGPRSEDWKFSARAGDTVIFRMKVKNGSIGALLVLTDAQDNVLNVKDEYSNYNAATLSHRFTSSGIYVLRCMDSSGSQEGSYTLSATRVRTRSR